MRDCRKILADNGYIGTLIKEETEKIYAFLEENHKQIMNTYDPKVVKLRKKRKIIMTDRAARDIGNMSTNAEPEIPA